MVCILDPGFIDCDFTLPFPLTSTLKPIFFRTFIASSSERPATSGTPLFIFNLLSILSRLETDSELILTSNGILFYIFFAIDLNTGAATVAP